MAKPATTRQPTQSPHGRRAAGTGSTGGVGEPSLNPTRSMPFAITYAVVVCDTGGSISDGLILGSESRNASRILRVRSFSAEHNRTGRILGLLHPGHPLPALFMP